MQYHLNALPRYIAEARLLLSKQRLDLKQP